MTEVTSWRIKITDETSAGASGVTRSLADIKRQAQEAHTGLDRLKSGFERLKESMFSMRGALAGLGLGLAVREVFQATIESERAMSQAEARIKSTGGAAGLTGQELDRMAKELQRVTAFGDDAILSAEALLLTFTKIGRDTFPQATEAVLDIATAMDGDLKGAAIQLGKALNDPVQGISALSRTGIQFSATQEELIKQFVETNQLAKAQAVILAEVNTQMGGAARAERDTLGGSLKALDEAFGDLMESDSLSGTRVEIEKLVGHLQSDAFRKAAGEIGEGLAGAFGKVLSALEGLSQWAVENPNLATALFSGGGGALAGARIAGPYGAAVGAAGGLAMGFEKELSEIGRYVQGTYAYLTNPDFMRDVDLGRRGINGDRLFQPQSIFEQGIDFSGGVGKGFSGAITIQAQTVEFQGRPSIAPGSEGFLNNYALWAREDAANAREAAYLAGPGLDLRGNKLGAGPQLQTDYAPPKGYGDLLDYEVALSAQRQEEARHVTELTQAFMGLDPEFDKVLSGVSRMANALATGDPFTIAAAGVQTLFSFVSDGQTQTERWTRAIQRNTETQRAAQQEIDNLTRSQLQTKSDLLSGQIDELRNNPQKYGGRRVADQLLIPILEDYQRLQEAISSFSQINTSSFEGAMEEFRHQQRILRPETVSQTQAVLQQAFAELVAFDFSAGTFTQIKELTGAQYRELEETLADLRIQAMHESRRRVAKAAVGADNLVFDVREIALRREAQRGFTQAGADPFAQAATYRALSASIEYLRAQELANAAGGGPGPSGAAKSAASSGSLGHPLTTPVAGAGGAGGVPGLSPVPVPWSSTVELFVDLGSRHVPSHWGNLVDIPADLAKYTRPWDSAVSMFIRTGSGRHYPSHWGNLVDIPVDLKRYERYWDNAVQMLVRSGAGRHYPSHWGNLVDIPADLAKYTRPWDNAISMFVREETRLRPSHWGNLVDIPLDLTKIGVAPSAAFALSAGVKDHVLIGQWDQIFGFSTYPDPPPAIPITPNTIFALATGGKIRLSLWDVLDPSVPLIQAAYGYWAPIVTLQPNKIFQLGPDKLRVRLEDIMEISALSDVVAQIIPRLIADRKIPTLATSNTTAGGRTGF